MKFRNIRNGCILDMPETFSGKYWEPVKKPAPEKPKAIRKTGAKKTEKK